VGDPDFDMAGNGVTREQAAAGTPGLHFMRLPSTRDEIVEIRSLFDKKHTVTLLGKEATEQTFIGISNPKIIHLATHGFFFSPQRPARQGRENRGEQEATLIRAEFNSMLRSGVAFAGANTGFEQGTSQGIATAEELTAMDLRQTELVVLSACETGTGDVVNGQGVMGLRRSFITAGAKSMVMSMWNVPDQETKKLMVLFYGNMIGKGMDRSSALREAMLRTREESIRQYGYDNPYYWGGFVFLGNPR